MLREKSPSISYQVHSQAKLKAMHEVVVRNRLEQLRKRQRDEAMVAQEELLAGNTKKPLARAWGGDMHAVAIQEVKNAKDDGEDAQETYGRFMSPAPIDLKRLSYEDRQLPIISEEEDIRMLVSVSNSGFSSVHRLSIARTPARRSVLPLHF